MPVSPEDSERRDESHDESISQSSASSSSSDKTARKSSKYYIVAAIAFAAVVIAVVAYNAYRSTYPQYIGLPDQVASKVGYMSDGSTDGPLVKVAVNLWMREEEGSDMITMWDPDQEYIVGFASLSKPLEKDEWGDVEVMGNVSSCDGENELDLRNASIID